MYINGLVALAERGTDLPYFRGISDVPGTRRISHEVMGRDVGSLGVSIVGNLPPGPLDLSVVRQNRPLRNQEDDNIFN